VDNQLFTGFLFPIDYIILAFIQGILPCLFTTRWFNHNSWRTGNFEFWNL